MTPGFLAVDELDKGQVQCPILHEGRGVTLRTFGPKEEHKVWSPFLKICENKGSVIFFQDQCEATEVLAGSRQDEGWPRNPKAVSPESR